MSVTLEKTRVNLFNIIGMLSILIANAISVGYIWANTTRDIAEVRRDFDARKSSLDLSLVAIMKKLEPLDNIQYRLTVTETKDKEQDERMNRTFETFSAKLDNITDSINNVRTDVKVLTQKVDLSLTGPKPTAYRGLGISIPSISERSDQ